MIRKTASSALCHTKQMPTRRRSASKRRLLVDAANNALLQHGSARTRLRDIAEMSGLTSPAVLYHFPNIEDLYTEVFELGSNHYCEARESQSSRAASPIERLRMLIAGGVPWPGPAEDATKVMAELIPVVLRNENAASQRLEFVKRQKAIYERLIREGQASGDFSPNDDVSLIARDLVAVEDGYALDVLAGEIAPSFAAERIWRFAAHSLGIDPSSSTAAPWNQIAPTSISGSSDAEAKSDG